MIQINNFVYCRTDDHLQLAKRKEFTMFFVKRSTPEASNSRHISVQEQEQNIASLPVIAEAICSAGSHAEQHWAIFFNITGSEWCNAVLRMKRGRVQLGIMLETWGNGY